MLGHHSLFDGTESQSIAMFRHRTQLDLPLETFWDNFRCGSPRCRTSLRPLPGLSSDWRQPLFDWRLEPNIAMCSHSWPRAWLVSPVARWLHPPHERLEILDSLQPFCAFFDQPRAMKIRCRPGAPDARDAADLRIEAQHGQSYLCRKWIIIIIYSIYNIYIYIIYF